MKVYRKVKQTKFKKPNLKGLLTLHDCGTIAVSQDHKELFNGLKYLEVDSYFEIRKPTTSDMTIVWDRLFDFKP